MSEKLNKIRYLHRIRLACWAGLLLCVLLKIFSDDLFEISGGQGNFKLMCDYAESQIWLRYLLGFIYSWVSTYFCILAMVGRFKYTSLELSIMTLLVVFSTGFKVWNQQIGLLADLVVMVIMPCIFSLKTPRMHWNVLIGNILLFIFQVTSQWIKNLSFGFVVKDGILVSCIYSLDVLFMVILYYLYSGLVNSMKEEDVRMSYFFAWLQGKDSKALDKLREKKVKKMERLQKEISAIDERKEQLESKN